MTETVREWYFFGPHRQHQGPYAIIELEELFSRGRLNLRSQLWREGEKRTRAWGEMTSKTGQRLTGPEPLIKQHRMARDQRAGHKLNQQWGPEKLAATIGRELTIETQSEHWQDSKVGHQSFFQELQNWDGHFLRPTISHQQQKMAQSQNLDSLQGLRYGVVGAKARALFLDTLVTPTPGRLRQIKLTSLALLFICASVVGLLPWEDWRTRIYHQGVNFPVLTGELSTHDYARLKSQAMAQTDTPQFELASDKKLSKIYLSSNYQGPLDLMVKLTSRPGEILSQIPLQAYGEARFMSHMAQLRDLKFSDGQRLAPGVYEVEIESKDRDRAGRPLFQQRKLVLLGFQSHREFFPELEKFQKLNNARERALAQALLEQWRTFYSHIRDFRLQCQDILLRYPSGEMAADKLQAHYLSKLGPYISDLAVEAKSLHQTHRQSHPRLALYWQGLYDLARAQGEFWSGRWDQVAGNDFLSDQVIKNLRMSWSQELLPHEEKAHSRLSRIEDIVQQLKDER